MHLPVYSSYEDYAYAAIPRIITSQALVYTMRAEQENSNSNDSLDIVNLRSNPRIIVFNIALIVVGSR